MGSDVKKALFIQCFFILVDMALNDHHNSKLIVKKCELSFKYVLILMQRDVGYT